MLFASFNYTNVELLSYFKNFIKDTIEGFFSNNYYINNFVLYLLTKSPSGTYFLIFKKTIFSILLYST